MKALSPREGNWWDFVWKRLCITRSKPLESTGVDRPDRGVNPIDPWFKNSAGSLESTARIPPASRPSPPPHTCTADVKSGDSSSSWQVREANCLTQETWLMETYPGILVPPPKQVKKYAWVSRARQCLCTTHWRGKQAAVLPYKL